MINNPFVEEGIIACQYCGSGEYLYNEDGNKSNFCGQCGYKIDWPEIKLDDWNVSTINLPKPCSTVIAKYGEREVRVWYSMHGNWMPDKPTKGDICDKLEHCYHNIKLISYKKENIDTRWFCVKDKTPPVPEGGMCSEDVIIKYKNGTECKACITFNGVWYNEDLYEVANKVVYWRYMTKGEKNGA